MGEHPPETYIEAEVDALRRDWMRGGQALAARTTRCAAHYSLRVQVLI